MTKRALEGLKVLEFAFIGVTPGSIRMLGTNGAAVIRVESKNRPDFTRTSGPYIDGKASLEHSAEFAHIHSDKYSIALNLKDPKGIEVAKQLVAWADVVADGFTTGALDNLGLGYEELIKINPGIIMLSCNTFGQTGPWASVASTGIQLTGISGFIEPTGWPDRGPVALGYYSDNLGPHFVLINILAALDYKRRTGKGQHIDVAQLEGALYFDAPLILDYVVNKRLAKRHGNRCSYAAPHGIYRCQGDDRWCAISVFTDDEWNRFCTATGNPPWTRDPKFATLLARKRNEDELDRLVEEWTTGHAAEEVMNIMQQEGISAGVVQNGEDLFKDPQMRHYDGFRWLYYPGIEKEFPTQMPCVEMSKTHPEMLMPRPMLGEHTEYVCTKILGMSDETFVQLMAEGVFE